MKPCQTSPSCARPTGHTGNHQRGKITRAAAKVEASPLESALLVQTATVLDRLALQERAAQYWATAVKQMLDLIPASERDQPETNKLLATVTALVPVR